MTEINRAGEPGSLGEVNTTQREFREQIDALNDIVRQIGGNPDVNPGSSFPSDPLSAPYVLYVDAYTGKDTFVGGDYNSKDDGTFEDKVRRISLQRLECGYTINRPFRTINRAIIEAAIITSRDFLTLKPGVCGDLVSIVVAAGVHEILNGTGEELVNVGEWQDGQIPTNAELQAFNPRTTGGLILPRGCSVVSLDLRKAILRPDFVPEPEAEEPDFSNRRAIFKVTGGGYYFGFTFLDKLGFNRSHHLLDAFQYASKSELDTFYAKILQCFGPSATGIDPDNAQSRLSEYQITGEVRDQPVDFRADSGGTDTVRSASPYIYNTSLRSTYGMCGIFADGDKVEGFKSMVVAQFTGVSLQNDYTCWQKYSPGSGGSWSPVADFIDYVNLDPDNLRQDPQQRSFHVRAVNEALIQEVSVFAIGQGIHHWAQSGGQLTITNSNSNFGGCSALAEGFQKKAALTDGPWTIKFFRTALNPLSKKGNINRIILGTIEDGVANASKSIELVSSLGESSSKPGQPEVLVRDGYSLKENDYLWIENPGGPDYRARLSGNPWDPSAPNILNVKDIFTTDSESLFRKPGDPDSEEPNLNAFPNIEGKRVYVRRLVDIRTVEERRYSILLKSENPGSVLRLPLRDYVIADPGVPGGYGQNVQAVAASENVLNNPDADVKVELRYSNKPNKDRDYDENTFYRKGDVVLRSRKHFTAIRDTTGPFKVEDFAESYVHMPTGEPGGLPSFIPEGSFTNAQPTITFDNDTDELEESTDLGNTIASVQDQIETAVDYLGLKYFLGNLGTAANPVLALADTEEERDKDVLNFLANVTTTEFRRPTNCRLFGQAYEWTGFANYSKALPQFQKELSPSNKFTYYFTNENGGKVFATGFNEEGLQVTPRGLEDITTGEVLSVTDIGNPDRDIDIPTSFPSLNVEGEFTLAGKIVKNQATTSDAGATKLASFSTTKVLTIAGSDEDINENGRDDGVVTPAWLNKWRIDNNILSAPDTQVSVYVNPVNGMDMTIEELAADPPNVPSKAVKSLKIAVEYANTVFGPEAVVRYLLGPGPYLETGLGSTDTITFKTIARLQAYDFEAGGPLSNSTGGGTVPFLQIKPNNPADKPVNDLALFDNPFKQPTFLTRSTVVQIQNSGVTSLRIRPLQLIFKQKADVVGIAWYGAAQSLKAWSRGQLSKIGDTVNEARVEKFFADFYKGQTANPEAFAADLKQAIGNATSSDDDSEAFNVLVSKSFDGLNNLPSGRVLNRTGSATSLVFEGKGTVVNCAFGASVAVPEGEGSVRSRGVIRTQGSPLRLRGIYLIGNVKLSDGPLSNYKFGSPTTTTFELRGFNETLISTDDRDRPEDSVNITFGGNDRNNDNDFNLVWNNIHLINNERKAGGNSDVFNEAGPVLESLIGSPGQLVLPVGIWSVASNTADGEFQGFVGKFGLIRSSDGNTKRKTRGLFGYKINTDVQEPTPGFKIIVAGAADKLTSFWRVAGSGNAPTLPPFNAAPNIDTPGVIEPNAADFDELNVSISLYNKGIDVVENTSSSQDLRL